MCIVEKCYVLIEIINLFSTKKNYILKTVTTTSTANR